MSCRNLTVFRDMHDNEIAVLCITGEPYDYGYALCDFLHDTKIVEKIMLGQENQNTYTSINRLAVDVIAAFAENYSPTLYPPHTRGLYEEYIYEVCFGGYSAQPVIKFYEVVAINTRQYDLICEGGISDVESKITLYRNNKTNER